MFDEKIISLCNLIRETSFSIHKYHKHGHLEKVYENSLMVLLRENGFKAEQQVKIKIHFHGKIVGDYIADIIVNDLVILELKAQEYLVEANEFQLINYLKATDCEVGLLLNFGKKPEFIRKVYQNFRK